MLPSPLALFVFSEQERRGDERGVRSSPSAYGPALVRATCELPGDPSPVTCGAQQVQQSNGKPAEWISRTHEFVCTAQSPPGSPLGSPHSIVWSEVLTSASAHHCNQNSNPHLSCILVSVRFERLLLANMQ